MSHNETPGKDTCPAPASPRKVSLCFLVSGWSLAITDYGLNPGSSLPVELRMGSDVSYIRLLKNVGWAVTQLRAVGWAELWAVLYL